MALLDEASILACAMYVDLNPIRAALAQTPETSEFTGAKDRLDDLKEQPVLLDHPAQVHAWERSGSGPHSGWMSPIEIQETVDPIGADACDGRRASRKGFLNLSLTDYLQLLDWTGRSLAAGKSGAIPASLAPILKRVGVANDRWCELVRDFGRLFKRAAGSAKHLAAEATARGQRCLHGPGTAIFTGG